MLKLSNGATLRFGEAIEVKAARDMQIGRVKVRVGDKLFLRNDGFMRLCKTSRSGQSNYHDLMENPIEDVDFVYFDGARIGEVVYGHVTPKTEPDVNPENGSSVDLVRGLMDFLGVQAKR